MNVPQPHILMLLENAAYPADGRVRREAQTLIRAGYRVTVICRSARTRKQLASEMIEGVRVLRYPYPPQVVAALGYVGEYSYAMAATLLLSMFVLFNDDFDAIHAHNPPDTFVLIALLYKLIGKRFVFDHHDLAPEMYLARFNSEKKNLIYRILVFFERLSARIADHVIVTNRSSRTIAIERSGVPSERISIVRNGPDMRLMHPEEVDRNKHPPDECIIMYIGVINPQDGVDYLLQAIRYLVFEIGRTNLACVVVGSGDALRKLKQMAADMDLSDYVTFTGWVASKEVPSYLWRSDICVAPEPSNPYNDRSTVIKLMEYMAAGKPIVAFDLPEHRYTAQEAALYAQPNDERDFARKIAFLMDHPNQGEAMGRIGRERVANQLAWSHQEQALLDAYQAVQSRANREKLKPLRAVAQKVRGLTYWLQKRNPRYIALRLQVLFKRYGFLSGKAERRTRDCVRLLAHHACSPTFPTPGRVVEQHSAFFRELQDQGSELSVHGYDHVDFNGLGVAEATNQFQRAIEAYRHGGIAGHGFRCPYLSYGDSARLAVQSLGFRYSSNKAIWWDVAPEQSVQQATAVFDQLKQFYSAETAADAVSIPTLCNGLVEIPVSLPDDLQLYDGLQLGPQGLVEAWLKLLNQTYQRGEMFVLLFHPEAFYQCAPAFEAILSEARRIEPAVWVARLCDIADWWWEKSRFTIDVLDNSDGLQVVFNCSERATILTRNLELDAPTSAWDDVYQTLDSRTLRISADVHPFIGIAPDVGQPKLHFLREQGYIVKTGADAQRCGIYLDRALVDRLSTDVQLIKHIESATAPMVRFWRWPNAYRSVLSITGDLDALSLLDYAGRLLPGR